jgi:fatty acid desaturase
VIAVAIGQCLTAFVAVWTVHHDCQPDRALARTIRGCFKSFVTHNMFYHLEHHLFPAVPTCRLPQLV